MVTAISAQGWPTMAHWSGNAVEQISQPPLVQVPCSSSQVEVATPLGLGKHPSVLDGQQAYGKG